MQRATVKQKATRPTPKNWLTSFVESETESDEVLSLSSSSSEKEPPEFYVEGASETKIKEPVKPSNSEQKMNALRKRTIFPWRKYTTNIAEIFFRKLMWK